MVRKSLNELVKWLFILLIVAMILSVPMVFIGEATGFNGRLPATLAEFTLAEYLFVFNMITLPIFFLVVVFKKIIPAILDLGQALIESRQNGGEDFP